MDALSPVRGNIQVYGMKLALHARTSPTAISHQRIIPAAGFFRGGAVARDIRSEILLKFT